MGQNRLVKNKKVQFDYSHYISRQSYTHRNSLIPNSIYFSPQQLELTGVNEQILMDNIDVFKKNGFTFDINEEALPTKRVKLLTIPMSKNWVFGKEDIEELLFMLRVCMFNETTSKNA